MQQYREYRHVIQYYEVDVYNQLRLNMMENFLLNAAGLAANDENIGLDRFYPQHISWVLTHFTIELNYIPLQGDTVIVTTWIERNVHTFSFRNYRIGVVKKGSTTPITIGEACSTWVLMDLIDRKLVNMFADADFSALETGESVSIEKTKRLKPMAEQPDIEIKRTIAYSDLDYNGHCNSCKYLEIFLDTYPDFLQGLKCFRIDMVYTKEVRLGENTTVRFTKESDDMLRFQMNTEAGLDACNALITIQ